MRYVDRSKVPPPESLSGAGCAGDIELTQAIAHFAQQSPGSFSFSAYKRTDVAEALNELFHGKCAYCESSIKQVAPTDVEHYRPKGKVSECPTHPGYWWLAMKWDNLLPSCVDCNRRRYHHARELAHDPMGAGKKGKHLLGKGDSFPILGLNHAMSAADDHGAEDAALIDPTTRDPRNHLVWLEVEDLSLVGPSIGTAGLDPYGRQTYRAFGLNRQGLVESRTTLMRDIRSKMVLIEKRLDSAAAQADVAVAELLTEIAMEDYLGLLDLAEPERPYSAMVDDLLQREADRLVAKYQALQPKGSLLAP